MKNPTARDQLAPAYLRAIWHEINSPTQQLADHLEALKELSEHLAIHADSVSFHGTEQLDADGVKAIAKAIHTHACLTEALANHLADELDRPDRLADKVAERLGLSPEASQAPAGPRIESALALAQPTADSDPRELAKWQRDIIEAVAAATGIDPDHASLHRSKFDRLLVIERGRTVASSAFLWEVCPDGRLIDLQRDQRTG